MPTTAEPPPFRFGYTQSRFGSRRDVVEMARWAQDSGFDAFSIADHLDMISVFVALQAVADAAPDLRLAPMVVNNDLRHVTTLAQDAATLDLLSDGRLELGVGAGWAKPEYDAAGVPFDRAGTRVDRLAEAIPILRSLFAGGPVDHTGPHYRLDGHVLSPAPAQGADLPVLIGGNGDRVLRLAGEQADIVGFTGFSPDAAGKLQTTHFSRAGLADRIAVVEAALAEAALVEAAKRRRPEYNLFTQAVVVSNKPEAELAETMAELFSCSPAEVADSPFVLFGSADRVAEQLRELRATFGLSYITLRGDESARPKLAALVSALR